MHPWSLGKPEVLGSNPSQAVGGLVADAKADGGLQRFTATPLACAHCFSCFLHLQQASTSVYATPDGPARIPNFASTSSTVPTPFSCCFRRHLSCHIARKFHDADKFMVHEFLTAMNGPAMPKMPVHNRIPTSLSSLSRDHLLTHWHTCRPAPMHTGAGAHPRDPHGLQARTHPTNGRTGTAPAQRVCMHRRSPQHPHGRTGAHARREQVARAPSGQGAQRTAGHMAGNTSRGGQRALTRLDRHLKNRARPGTNAHIPTPGRTHQPACTLACARTPSVRRQPAPASTLSHTHPPARTWPRLSASVAGANVPAHWRRHPQTPAAAAPTCAARLSHTRMARQGSEAVGGSARGGQGAQARGGRRVTRRQRAHARQGPTRDRGPTRVAADSGPARGGGPFIRTHGGWTLSSSTYDV
ncbi:hypothetical protein GGX14DRAFT_604193 [Mycena pura]|uniref:Uncharacterized protein n=1 Tax=Mycena pura TaxID=153505 RepID=A0AAD6UU97_9AGAR|nr:hypothetical protein GGX14DRAFT_604193 [Mycena pura]